MSYEMNLLVTGAANINKELLENLELRGWYVDLHQQEREVVEDPGKYDGVVCNGLFLHNPIERFENLKVIQLTSAGLDRVPVDYINRKGIKLYNARGVYSIPMAEWVLANILNEYKYLSFFRENQSNQQWLKKRDIRELYGRKAAIIGAGNIGEEVAKRLSAFGVQVEGYDLHISDRKYFDSINQINKFSPKNYDFVVITAPHTPSTHHFFNVEILKSLPLNAIIIAMSRGGIIDENALINVLKVRPDIIAVLDVFEQEPLASESQLWNLDNIRIFPHNSFVGDNNQARLHSVILENLTKRFIQEISQHGTYPSLQAENVRARN